MSVDYPGAIDMILPDSYTFNSVAPLKIVDHCTGGDMDLTSLHNTFLATMRSTHFGIDRMGNVAQFVRLNRGAGGNCCPDTDTQGNYLCSAFWVPLVQQYGNLNLCTISIEHCNDSNNDLALTPAQQMASNKLNLWLCQQFNLTTNDIHSHASINPINKARCPGPMFDFTQMFNYINANLNGGSNPVFSDTLCIEVWNSFFQQQGSTLTLPPRDTGIFNSWRDQWKNHNNFLGCPLTPEYPVTLPNGNPGVAQNYAGGTCVWDNVKGGATWL